MTKKSSSSTTSNSARKVVPFITRHRPTRFEDMIGLDSQLVPLAKSIEAGEIPNAFLIMGTTGGGKTTLARIIARVVMCETRNACGQCASCKIADEDLAQHPDYEENNCGVKGKIDDIRALDKLSQTVPQIGKMRVIVLDEAHRLTGPALEAILKPLEEPAPQTLWILATTDANSLKDTLKNRCAKVYIKPAPADILGKYLARISWEYVQQTEIPKKELLKLTTEIAEMTGGYIRESLTIMDSVIKTLKADGSEDINVLLGNVREQLLSNVDADAYAAQKLILAVFFKNPKAISQILANQDDFVRLTRNILDTMQYIIDAHWGTRGSNIYHPPVFTQTFSDLKSRFDEREISTISRIKAYSIALTAFTQLHGKIMSFTCPERPLITSILLDVMFEVSKYTGAKNKE